MCIYTYIFTHINKGLILPAFLGIQLRLWLESYPQRSSYVQVIQVFSTDWPRENMLGLSIFPWDWLIFGHEMVATATQHGDINQSFRLGGSSPLVIACPACITVFLREYTSMFDCFFMIQEMGILSNPILSEGTTSNCQLVRCSPRIHIYVYIYIYINIYATISKG